MAVYKSFRVNNASLAEWDTLLPLLKQCKSTVRFWWWSSIYLWLTTLGIFALAGKYTDWVTIFTILFLINCVILLILYSKNNNKNYTLLSMLKDYRLIKKVEFLYSSYITFLRWMKVIFIVDIFLWPITFLIKFFVMFSYFSFKRSINRLKKLIVQGEMTLIPDEEEIMQDPFYHFLQREGLYEPEEIEEIEMEVDEEKIVEETSEEGEDAE